MMKVNLIPASRRAARRHIAYVRGWAAGCTIYALAVILVYALCLESWGDDAGHLADDLELANRQIGVVQRDLADLHDQIADAREILAANRAVGEQPDFSVLLAMLVSQLQEQVVLRRCELEPIIASPPRRRIKAGPNRPKSDAARAPAARYRLALDGLGRSQSAVAQFVVRLEDTGLFDQVKLLGTLRQPFLTGQAIGFELECFLGESRTPMP